MSNVFFACELGSNLGHMGGFLPLAKVLRGRGHQVHWALARTREAATLLQPAGFSWMQAPVLNDRCPSHTPESYTGILRHFGYEQASSLKQLVDAWRELMMTVGTHVVLVDHAPTAILAARTLGLPVMNHGNGFSFPPAQSPTPALRSWHNVPHDVLCRNDEVVLASINAVLAEYGCKPLTTVAQLFDVAEPGLLTYAELDPYERAVDTRYWGSTELSSGASPVWPAAPGPKVFAYVRAAGAHYMAVLQALRQLQASVLVVAPGLSEAQRRELALPHFSISNQVVDIALAAREADAGVLWGGGGSTTALFLRAGKPVLLLPSQLEPFLLGLKVQAIGAGLVADLSHSLNQLPQLLQHLLQDSSLSSCALAFSERYSHLRSRDVLEEMAARVGALAFDGEGLRSTTKAPHDSRKRHRSV